MRSDAFRNVREPLLRAGVAPRHVRRYIIELQDHEADLISKHQAEGMDARAAQQKARQMLGTDAQLVQAMLDSKPPRALAAQRPWAVFGLFPAVALLIATFALGVFAMGFFSRYMEVDPATLPPAVGAMAAAISFVGSYGIGAALIAVCIAIAARQRQFSASVWLGLGATALVFGVLGVSVDIVHAADGGIGSIRGSLAQFVRSPDGGLDVGSSLLLISARALGLFILAAAALRLLDRSLSSKEPAGNVT